MTSRKQKQEKWGINVAASNYFKSFLEVALVFNNKYCFCIKDMRFIVIIHIKLN